MSDVTEQRMQGPTVAELERQLLEAEQQVRRHRDRCARLHEPQDRSLLMKWQTVMRLLRDELAAEASAVSSDRGCWPTGPTRWGG